MNILVTGGAGYIGSHVTRMLSEKGHKLVVVDDLSTGFSQNLVHGETLVTIRLQDQGALEKVMRENKIESVMHFAAKISVPESTREPALYYENNTLGTFSLLNACAAAKIRHFVFSSTAAVY